METSNVDRAEEELKNGSDPRATTTHADRCDAAGRRQVVRNRHLPARELITGAGRIEASQQRVRDRSEDKEGRVRFSSSILPPYLRRTKSMEELIPWLYLKGISTGDFNEALQSLLGVDCPNLSANVFGSRFRLSLRGAMVGEDLLAVLALCGVGGGLLSITVGLITEKLKMPNLSKRLMRLGECSLLALPIVAALWFSTFFVLWLTRD